MSWTTVVVLCCGFGSGILASLLGIGGAVITTPAIRFLGATPIQAVGSTVPAILPGAVSGALRYHREGLIDWHVARVCGLTGMVFAIGGGITADVVEGRWLMVATAALVMWSGSMLLRAGLRESPDHGPATTPVATPLGPPRRSLPALLSLGVIGGFVAGLLGVGGGLILTPGLSVGIRLPVKQAIATSLTAVAMMSVTSVTTHIVLDHVDWAFALPLMAGIVPGARLGAHITIGASDRAMRIGCGAAMVALGVVYGTRELLIG